MSYGHVRAWSIVMFRGLLGVRPQNAHVPHPTYLFSQVTTQAPRSRFDWHRPTSWLGSSETVSDRMLPGIV